MVDSFHTLITRAGAALIADAASRGTVFRLATLVAGSRDAAPDETATAVPDEVWRGPITGVTPGADDGSVVIDAAIPLDEGGFTIRQIGVLDSDGALILHASVPEAYKPTRAAGAVRDLAYRLVVRFANAESVNLLIDPHIVTATRKWTESFVGEAIAAHNTDPAAHGNLKVPNATIEWRGIAELATGAETATGTDRERVVTPFGLRSALPPVLRPVNRSPGDGDTAVGDIPALTGSEYFSLYGLPQGGAAFEVIDADDQAVHAGASAGAGTTYTVPAETLTISTVYTWRCRYRDNSGAWSAWSLPTRFTTAASFQSVTAPTVTAPAGGATDVPLPLVIVTSAFVGRGDPQDHAATQYQVATDSEFAEIVYDSDESRDLLRHAVPGTSDVLGETAYRLRARHKGAATGWSDWSAAVAITTAPAQGETLFETSSTFTVPAGVREVSVVCVGGGASSNQGGGGGALAWRNAIAVTPGDEIPVTVGIGGEPGQPGGTSSFGRHCSAAGGSGLRGGPPPVGTAGGGGGDGGVYPAGAGAGGAGGYGGTADNDGGAGGGSRLQAGAVGQGGGGAGGTIGVWLSGSRVISRRLFGSGGGGGGGRGAGAGGQGNDHYHASRSGGGGGGGVGLYGAGISGASNGAGGSDGTDGGPAGGRDGGDGGRYGGGASSSHHGSTGGGGGEGRGGAGAIRVIWGAGRSFPDNAGRLES